MSIPAVVVGSLVMDFAFRIPKQPAPGEVVVATEFGMYRGGKGYNQAVALARMGADVTMVGAVGADEHGDAFVAALESEGVDAGGVLQMRGVSTALAVPLTTPDGDVGFVQHPGANRMLTPAHVAHLPDCDVLLLQGELDPLASEQAGRVIRSRGGMVHLNPAPVHEVTEAMLAAASVLTPNEVEARSLVPSGEGLSDGELARALVSQDRIAVVTLGARGASYAAPDGTAGHAPAVPVEAVDATAAGDSFCAALALRLAEGAQLPEAIGFACAAGAHASTVVGAEPALPTRAQVEALVATVTPPG